jgi:Eukaryotic membrane protein family
VQLVIINHYSFICLLTAGHLYSSLPYCIIALLHCQAIADWIKHAFISKFNHISANVYDDFARVLRKDVLNCHKDKVILDQTYAITKRVGLAQVIHAMCSLSSFDSFLCLS